MQTYTNLYDKIYSYNNLLLAYKKARKGKTKKDYILEYGANLIKNLLKLQEELINETYKPDPLRRFIIRDPKIRVIHISKFKDRIVHHALCNIIEPIFEKIFIYDSCASRKHKGNLFALKRFDKFKRKITKNNTINCFALKADIKHYFQEVNHSILIKIIENKISDKKIDYSVSYYNTTLFEFIKDIIKDKFKKERVKAIYKKPKRKTDRFLTPTELINRKIITNGLDIVIYKNFIAKTIAVYNPYEIEKRDLDRPNKDFLKTTSLRLAKILVNLSGAKENSWLLDPFVGTGTILQEALLKNINVFGVDLDGNSVRDSIENLKWLKNTYNLSGKISIFEGDAANLTRTIKNKVDTIVCEPYMGPFLSREPSKEQAFQIIRNLKFIYTRFFNEAYKILDKNGRLVIIMPEISGISINPLNLTGDFMLYEPRLPLKLPIPYVLKNNKIKRYIYILEPK